MAEVGLYGALADAELVRDLFVGLPVGGEPQRRELARSELNVRHPFGQLRGGGRRQIGFPGKYIADAADEVFRGDVLEDVSLGARLERARDLVVGVIGRE